MFLRPVFLLVVIPLCRQIAPRLRHLQQARAKARKGLLESGAAFIFVERLQVRALPSRHAGLLDMAFQFYKPQACLGELLI
jgi:hypothetical protein